MARLAQLEVRGHLYLVLVGNQMHPQHQQALVDELLNTFADHILALNASTLLRELVLLRSRRLDKD
jgi:hypothetical protein